MVDLLAAKAMVTASELRVIRFRPEHLKALNLQAAQQDGVSLLARPEYGAALSLAGEAYTVFVGQHPIACIGVQEHHADRVEAWALLGDDSGPWMRPITRAVLGWLQQVRYRRVEAVVSAEFEAGHRWAKLLGFEREGVHRAYLPGGQDAVTYARIDHHDGSAVSSTRRSGGRRDQRDPQREPREQHGQGERGRA